MTRRRGGMEYKKRQDESGGWNVVMIFMIGKDMLELHQNRTELCYNRQHMYSTVLYPADI